MAVVEVRGGPAGGGELWVIFDCLPLAGGAADGPASSLASLVAGHGSAAAREHLFTGEATRGVDRSAGVNQILPDGDAARVLPAAEGTGMATAKVAAAFCGALLMFAARCSGADG